MLRSLCVVSALAVACPALAQIPTNTAIRAPADVGINEEQLGMGIWSDFQDVDPNGKTVRVYPLKKKETADSRYDVDFLQVTNRLQLKANANYMVASGGIAADESKRYMVLRVVRMTKVVSLDNSEDRVGYAPMYVSRIIYGWSYTVVFEGEASNFSASVASKLLSLGGDAAVTAEKNSIRYVVRTIGLRPKAGQGAIPTSTNPTDIAAMFEVEEGIKPQPILVEYRTTEPLETGAIEWTEPSFAEGDYEVRDVSLVVQPSKVNGDKWDTSFSGGGGRPDPKFFLSIDGSASGPFCLQKDSFEVKCSPGKVVHLNKDSRIELAVIDQDASNDDPIGNAYLRRPLAAEKPETRITLSTGGQLQSASFVLVLAR